MTTPSVDESRVCKWLLCLVSGTTSLLLVAFLVAVLLSGYYAQACARDGGAWGILTLVGLLLLFPYTTLPAWFALAFVLAKYLQPVQSVRRYFMTLLGSLLLALIVFGLGWLFALLSRAFASCSFGF